MAKDFIDILGDAFSQLKVHCNPAFYFNDFTALLTKKEIDEFTNYFVQASIKHDSSVDIKKYLEDSYDITNLKDIKIWQASQMINDIFSVNRYWPYYDDVIDFLLKKLDGKLIEAEKCAHLLSKKSFNEVSAVETLKEVKGLKVQLGDDYEHLLRDKYDEELIYDFINYHPEEYIDDIWPSYEQLFNDSKVKVRHPLYASNYTLILKPSTQNIIINPMDQIIMESMKKPDIIRSLTPRDFEKFIARIWEGFGFSIDLTAQTRDGGVDIICMSYKHGIPLKIAIEVKRYHESRPIGVELVRSFVGANSLIKANKLVYVSTSKYTKDAKNYADQLINLLELKELPDILEWSNQYVQIRYPDYRLK